MAPYRQGTRSQAAPSQGSGVVDEIIEQFADRFAFLRELVQNAIDADTEVIDVSLRYSPGDRLLTAAVTDHGVGMSQETMEDDLLVLFRSSKEDDESKIGKFGIGFASVLSMSPRVVRVNSSHDGRRHVLQLYPDLSYELFLSGRTQSSGTSVELELEMEPDVVDAFVLNAWQALTKWCRHASTEIRLRATDAYGHATIDERVDSPLGFADSLVTLEHCSEDGTKIALALRPEPGAYIAFFNSGLLLHESEDSPLGPVACKIQDPKLGHTLSRDNVRRDDRYDKVLALAESLVSSALPDRIGAQLRRHVEEGNLSAYDALLERTTGAHLGGNAKNSWPVPLIHPVDGRVDIAADKLGHFCAFKRSPLSEALAGRDIPVANLCDDVGSVLVRRAAIAALARTSLLDVDQCLTLIVPRTTHNDLAAAIYDHLDECFRPPRELFIADVYGDGEGRQFLSGSPDRAWLPPLAKGGSWILEECDRPALSRFRRRGLILNAKHPWIRAALVLSTKSRDTAARWLVRLILLEHEALTIQRSLELLETR